MIEELTKAKSELATNKKELSEVSTRFQKYKPLDDILNEVSSKKFSEDYKCLNFSQDLVNKLSSVGIQSEVVIGEDLKTINQPYIKHAWASIWVEPQTGDFTTNYTK